MMATATTLPIPPMDEFGLPAPVWIFELLLIVTMLLHFAFMNFTLGGAVVATLLDVLTLAGRGDHNLVVRLIWQIIPVTLSLTITTGVAPLLFVQVLYGHFFYTANVFLGFVWFALIPILIVAFYLTYLLSYRLGNAISNRVGVWNRRPGKRLAISGVVMVLFASVAWTLTNNHMLSIQPDAWAVDSQWRQNRPAVTPATTVPRYLHFVGGAIAVSGLWIAGIGWWRRWRGVDPPDIAAAITRTGMRIYLPMAVAAAILGPVFLFSLPDDIRATLFDAHLYSMLWWVGLAGVAAQLFFGMMAMSDACNFRWFSGLGGSAVVTVVGMLCGREAVRLAYLGREAVGFELADWEVHSQWTAFALFAGTFVAALVLIGWLVRVSVRAR